jgi:MarR-like DNA-binding transcriptional regulator SgrR of sgrS sRNA
MPENSLRQNQWRFLLSTQRASPAGDHIDDDDVLTITEIASILKCSKNHVSKLLNGKVPGVAVLAHFVMGRRKLSRRGWLMDWMEANKKQC